MHHREEATAANDPSARLAAGGGFNIEEYAALSILFGADATDGDSFGVRFRQFLDGFCQYALRQENLERERAGKKLPIDIFSRDLKQSLYREARYYGSRKKPAYKTLFDLLDEDKNGSLSIDEFSHMLQRLQITSSLSDADNKKLVAMFDKRKTGIITLNDFIAFIEDRPKVAVDEEDDDDDAVGGGSGGISGSRDDMAEDEDKEEEEEDDLELMQSSIPPAIITKDKDSDWLLWFLYKEAHRAEPLDPESILTELLNECVETSLSKKHPSITVRDLWAILHEMNLRGGMRAEQFAKGVSLFCQRQDAADDDRVDFEALCRNIVKMGRAFLQLLQEHAKRDEGKFQPLLDDLKKYFEELTNSEK